MIKTIERLGINNYTYLTRSKRYEVGIRIAQGVHEIDTHSARGVEVKRVERALSIGSGLYSS